MAKHIQYTPQPKTPTEKLHDAQHESAEALTESLKLLRELHGAGVIDLLYKVTKGGEGLSASLLHTLSDDTSVRTIRNVLELGKMLSGLDPQAVAQVGHAVTLGLDQAAQSVAQGKRLGLPELIKLMADKDVQVALSALFALLKGAGMALSEARGDTHDTANQAEFGRHQRIEPLPNAPKAGRR